MFGRFYNYYSPPNRDDNLFRSSIISQLMMALSIPFLFISFFTDLITHPVTWIWISLLYCFVLQFPLYYVAFALRRTRITRPEYLQILENAKRKLQVSRTVDAHLSKNTGRLLTSANTPFQYGIMVSERAATLIEETPLEGEVVLAYELAKLRRDKIGFSILRNIGAFYYTLVFEGMVFAELILSIVTLLEMIPLWIPALLLTYPCGFGIAVWYYLKAAAENEVESIYGMNPELATFKVFTSKNMSSEGRDHYIHEIESDIEMRKSRTKFSMVGKPLIFSSIIVVIAYILLMGITGNSTSFFAVLVGGVSFMMMVYSSSMKGTKRPGPPESLVTPRPIETEDETSVQVAKLVGMNHGNQECVIHKDYEIDDEDGLVVYEILVGEKRLLLFNQEWDSLESPELISAYIEGKLARRIANFSIRLYAVVVIAFFAFLIGGFVLVSSRVGFSVAFLFGWTILSFFILAILLMIFKMISTRREFKAELEVADRNSHYLQALRTLVKNSDGFPIQQTRYRRRVMKIEDRKRASAKETLVSDDTF
jgi:hypothetical protein